ncbi:hypothetical protein SDRG_15700 [Saprolegnia diclina VS20]|uniref:Uncharacterized protein n=1 Tax=Saprolegnia diclina (strain VS20) TaxID=1156394 RepID=T0PZF6_SAPDV|nr:hypothetical protein SDRG_15700 [Saprolegnia diclina VS20]EQC26455.1 hypothetical protein SDRG_15700 [Saprolegnia diclina VS20]|eukprot:XP_008620101.1 hypothetical protein SDRG_15700 [Saprolegnia diclina VS20]
MAPSTVDVLRRLDGAKVTSLSVCGGQEHSPMALATFWPALEPLALTQPLPSNMSTATGLGPHAPLTFCRSFCSAAYCDAYPVIETGAESAANALKSRTTLAVSTKPLHVHQR